MTYDVDCSMCSKMKCRQSVAGGRDAILAELPVGAIHTHILIERSININFPGLPVAAHFNSSEHSILTLRHLL